MSILQSRRTPSIPPARWSSLATQAAGSWRTAFYDCSPFCRSSWSSRQRWWTPVRENAASDVDVVSESEIVDTIHLVRGRGRTRLKTDASPEDHENPQSQRLLRSVRLLQAYVPTVLFHSFVAGPQPKLDQHGLYQRAANPIPSFEGHVYPGARAFWQAR